MESKLKETDLMIGAWIFSHETQSYQQITSISKENVTINAVTFDYPTYDEIESIPLTTKLLEKCECIEKIKILNTLTLCSKIKQWYLIINGDKYYFNYIHQLQQLIRLLTKQELIINL